MLPFTDMTVSAEHLTVTRYCGHTCVVFGDLCVIYLAHESTALVTITVFENVPWHTK